MNKWIFAMIHLVIGLLLLMNCDVMWFASYTILSYIVAIIIDRYYLKIEEKPKLIHPSVKCSKCGNDNLKIERSPFGKTKCMSCGFEWKN